MKQQIVYIVIKVVLCSLLVLSRGDEVTEECKEFDKQQMYKCCKMAEGVEIKLDGRVEIFKACHDSIFTSKDNGTSREEKLECLEECVFNGSKFLTTDMKLNKEAIADGFAVDLGINEQWKNAIAKSLSVCFESDLTKGTKEDAKCKSGSLQLVKCFAKQIFLNCPDDSWQKDKEGCSKAKEIMGKCSLSLEK